jgi:transcriptional regulator with PAS, ATPase and Fis domain
MAYDWPGNVRQLQNVMERVIALSPGRTQIGAAELPEEVLVGRPAPIRDTPLVPEEGVELDRAVSAYELALITRALERTSGNKRQAAELLHVKRTTLIEKLKRLERS